MASEGREAALFASAPVSGSGFPGAWGEAGSRPSVRRDRDRSGDRHRGIGPWTTPWVHARGTQRDTDIHLARQDVYAHNRGSPVFDIRSPRPHGPLSSYGGPIVGRLSAPPDLAPVPPAHAPDSAASSLLLTSLLGGVGATLTVTPPAPDTPSPPSPPTTCLFPPTPSPVPALPPVSSSFFSSFSSSSSSSSSSSPFFMTSLTAPSLASTSLPTTLAVPRISASSSSTPPIPPTPSAAHAVLPSSSAMGTPEGSRAGSGGPLGSTPIGLLPSFLLSSAAPASVGSSTAALVSTTSLVAPAPGSSLASDTATGIMSGGGAVVTDQMICESLGLGRADYEEWQRRSAAVIELCAGAGPMQWHSLTRELNSWLPAPPPSTATTTLSTETAAPAPIPWIKRVRLLWMRSVEQSRLSTLFLEKMTQISRLLGTTLSTRIMAAAGSGDRAATLSPAVSAEFHCLVALLRALLQITVACTDPSDVVYLIRVELLSMCTHLLELPLFSPKTYSTRQISDGPSSSAPSPAGESGPALDPSPPVPGWRLTRTTPLVRWKDERFLPSVWWTELSRVQSACVRILTHLAARNPPVLFKKLALPFVCLCADPANVPVHIAEDSLGLLAELARMRCPEMNSTLFELMTRSNECSKPALDHLFSACSLAIHEDVQARLTGSSGRLWLDTVVDLGVPGSVLTRLMLEDRMVATSGRFRGCDETDGCHARHLPVLRMCQATASILRMRRHQFAEWLIAGGFLHVCYDLLTLEDDRGHLVWRDFASTRKLITAALTDLVFTDAPPPLSARGAVPLIPAHLVVQFRHVHRLGRYGTGVEWQHRLPVDLDMTRTFSSGRDRSGEKHVWVADGCTWTPREGGRAPRSLVEVIVESAAGMWQTEADAADKPPPKQSSMGRGSGSRAMNDRCVFLGLLAALIQQVGMLRPASSSTSTSGSTSLRSHAVARPTDARPQRCPSCEDHFPWVAESKRTSLDGGPWDSDCTRMNSILVECTSRVMGVYTSGVPVPGRTSTGGGHTFDVPGGRRMVLARPRLEGLLETVRHALERPDPTLGYMALVTCRWILSWILSPASAPLSRTVSADTCTQYLEEIHDVVSKLYGDGHHDAAWMEAAQDVLARLDDYTEKSETEEGASGDAGDEVGASREYKSKDRVSMEGKEKDTRKDGKEESVVHGGWWESPEGTPQMSARGRSVHAPSEVKSHVAFAPPPAGPGDGARSASAAVSVAGAWEGAGAGATASASAVVGAGEWRSSATPVSFSDTLASATSPVRSPSFGSAPAAPASGWGGSTFPRDAGGRRVYPSFGSFGHH